MSTQTPANARPEAAHSSVPTPSGLENTKPRPPWLIVMLNQISITVRRKAFVISTLVTVLVIVGGVIGFGLLSSKVDKLSVAVTSQKDVAVVQAAQGTAEANGAKVELSATVSANPVESVRNKDADLALTQEAEGWKLTARDSTPTTALTVLSQAVEQTTVQAKSGASGVSWAELTQGSTLTPVLLEGDAQRNGMASAVGYVFAMMFYLAAILFGTPLATSVLQEKASRVVEILAATIPLRQLLAGKIAASTVLAVLQIALYVGAGLLALSFSPAELGFTGVIVSTAGWFLVFFLAGFLILAAIYASIGAMAHRGEDLSASQMPVIFVLLLSLFAGLGATGNVLVASSFVPIISSVTMPVRMLQTDVPMWQTLLSLAISLATAYLLIRLGGKIFRLSVLHTSGALNWKSALALKD